MADTPKLTGAEALVKIRAAYPQYQSLSDQDLAKALIRTYPERSELFKDIAAPPNLAQRGYRGATAIASKPFEWAGNLDVALGIKDPETAARRAKTYGGITTDLALTAPFTGGAGSAGKLAAEALGVGKTMAKVLPAVGRTAGSALGGAATSAGRGEDPVTGAITSGLAAGAGEAVPAVLPAAKRFVASRLPWVKEAATATEAKQAAQETKRVAQAMATKTRQSMEAPAKAAAKETASVAKQMAARTRQSMEADVAAREAAAAEAAKETAAVARQMVKTTRASSEASRIGRAMGPQIPGLDAQTSQDLYTLAAGGKGREVLNAQFKATLRGITDQLKGAKITKIRVPLLGNEPMTVDEAVTALQMVGKGIGKAAPGEKSVTQNLALLDYRQVRNDLVNRLESLVPGTGKALDQQLANLSRGRAYLKLIEKSTDKNGVLNPDRLAENVNKAAGKLGEKFGASWPQVQQILTGGRALPVAMRPPLTGTAWRPTIPSVPPPTVSPPGTPWMPSRAPASILEGQPWVREAAQPRGVPAGVQTAIDVGLAQPGVREAAIGAGFGMLERLPLLGPHGWHSDVLYDSISEQ